MAKERTHAVKLRRLLVTISIVVCLVPVTAAQSATGSVAIEPRAVAVSGEVQIRVRVTCSLDEGEQLLEGLVTASQGSASAMRGLTPVCDGMQRTYVLRLTPFDGGFTRGEAFVSVFFLFIDESSQTTTVQASSPVNVLGPA
jgi:hypothetical protein